MAYNIFVTINWNETGNYHQAARVLKPTLQDTVFPRPRKLTGWMINRDGMWQQTTGTIQTYRIVSEAALRHLPTDPCWDWMRGRLATLHGFQSFMSAYRFTFNWDEMDALAARTAGS